MPIDGHVQPVSEEAAPAGPTGSETVLIVDDEPLVLRLCCSILQGQGYNVLSASSGEDALNLGSAAVQNLRLLLSDIIMPKMLGTELAARFRKINPGIRVLFMSGFDAAEIPEYNGLRDSLELIPKPFTPIELLAAVRAALDKAPCL